MLDSTLYTKLIDELAPKLWYLTLYFQGEPFLHPKLTELIRYANKKGVYTATSTNAHFVSYAKAEQIVRSGLNKLIVSIDGTDQQTYEQYRRGGKLEKALEGARHVVAWKNKLNSKTPLVVFQFLVVRPNQHQIEDIKVLARKTGVDKVVFKTAQVYDYKNGNKLIPTIARYSRYKALGDGSYAIKNDLRNRCWRMWSGSVITWDGNVVPCCFDKDAKHVMGHVSKGGFKQVWRQASYRSFRSALLTSRKKIDICQNCTEGMKVKVMNEV